MSIFSAGLFKKKGTVESLFRFGLAQEEEDRPAPPHQAGDAADDGHGPRHEVFSVKGRPFIAVVPGVAPVAALGRALAAWCPAPSACVCLASSLSPLAPQGRGSAGMVGRGRLRGRARRLLRVGSMSRRRCGRGPHRDGRPLAHRRAGFRAVETAWSARLQSRFLKRRAWLSSETTFWCVPPPTRGARRCSHPRPLATAQHGPGWLVSRR